MPVTTTAPCPVEGCDGAVDVEVQFKAESPPTEGGCKPGGVVNVEAVGFTLIGNHMRDRHPGVEIPANLRGA